MECSDYPETESPFPVLFCDYGDEASPWRHPAPWGEHISIAAFEYERVTAWPKS